MTKAYFLLFLCLGLINNAFAQQYENEPLPATPPTRSNYTTTYNNSRININKLRFGAYFAPAVSWLQPTASKSDDGNYFVSSNGAKPGYTWGLMADYFFAPNYGIATGFNINTIGGNLINSATSKLDTTTANTVKYANFDYTLQFIEIPLALKLQSDPLSAKGLRIFGQIGLTLAINIGRKIDYTVNYNDNNGLPAVASGNNEKLEGTLAVPPVMIQMNLGAGLEYPIRQKLAFYFGLFFNNGFLPSAVNPQNYTLDYTGSFSSTNTRLNSFAFRFGMFF